MGGGGRGRLAQQEPLGFAVLPPPFDFFFFPFFPPKGCNRQDIPIITNEANTNFDNRYDTEGETRCCPPLWCSQLSSEFCCRRRREDEMEAERQSTRLIVEVEGQSWDESLLPITRVFQNTGRKAVVSEVLNERVPFPRGLGNCWGSFFFHHLFWLFSSHYLAFSLLLFGFATDGAQRAFLPCLSLLFMLSFAAHTTLNLHSASCKLFMTQA